MAKDMNVRAEASRICNLVPSRNTNHDWKIEQAVAAKSVVIKPVPFKLGFDLREAWWTISDQENTGSCVGWASTDGVLRYHMVKAGKIGQNDKLSARCTWMGSKETDQFVNRPTTFIEGSGTSLKAAMDILKKYGTVPESMLPFKVNTKMYVGNENDFFATASNYRIAAYFNLGKNFDDWKKWLKAHGPIMAGLGVDATWDNATATKGKLDTFQPATVRGGHAVTIVGYTADNRFIIRNSWGTGWGDAGFAYASEAYIQAGFYDESYGVTL